MKDEERKELEQEYENLKKPTGFPKMKKKEKH